MIHVTEAHGNDRDTNVLSGLSSKETAMGNTTAYTFNISFFSL